MSDVITQIRHANVEEVKTASLASTKIDLPGDQPGTFSAFVNVTNIIDHDNDKIMPGAFSASLAQRNPKVFWGHDPNIWIGKTLQAEELLPGDARLPDSIRAVGGGALWVRGQFNLDTQAGREAYSNAKFFGEDVEWSVGFRIPVDSAKFDAGTKIRTIEKVDLYEYSMVYAGASPGTHTQTIKESPMSDVTETKEEVEADQWVEFVLEDGTVLRGMFRIVPPEELVPASAPGGEEAMSVDKTKSDDDVDPAVAEAYAKGREDALAEVWVTAEWLHAERDVWFGAESEWEMSAPTESLDVADAIETVETVGESTDTVEEETALVVDDASDASDVELSDADLAEIEALELQNDIAAGDLL